MKRLRSLWEFAFKTTLRSSAIRFLPMRGLIIRQPWIDYILEGRKTWEIRSKPTKVRERIALIQGGSGTVVGTASLVDVIGPQSFAELRKHGNKHCAPDEALAAFLQKYRDKAYAWVLDDVVPLKTPVLQTSIGCRHLGDAARVRSARRGAATEIRGRVKPSRSHSCSPSLGENVTVALLASREAGSIAPLRKRVIWQGPTAKIADALGIGMRQTFLARSTRSQDALHTQSAHSVVTIVDSPDAI
jgi:hypothetical protein